MAFKRKLALSSALVALSLMPLSNLRAQQAEPEVISEEAAATEPETELAAKVEKNYDLVVDQRQRPSSPAQCPDLLAIVSGTTISKAGVQGKTGLEKLANPLSARYTLHDELSGKVYQRESANKFALMRLTLNGEKRLFALRLVPGTDVAKLEKLVSAPERKNVKFNNYACILGIKNEENKAVDLVWVYRVKMMKKKP